MKRIFCTLGFMATALGLFAQTTFDIKAKAYIKKYGPWAIEEQQRVGIPASITLAQGIYETGAGESELATMANNHFGIKCKKEWRGETFAHTDDAPNECFRKYSTAKDSYKDHSDYLKSSLRYAELFTYDKSDYTAWAKGLKRCGYATNPAYAQKLIKMIEDYDLQMYTFAADGKRVNEVVPVEEQAPAVVAPLVAENENEDPNGVKTNDDGTSIINGIRAIYCRKGETLLDKAMKFNIRYARLLEINELADEPLKRDMYIYLEGKKLKGAHPHHLVEEGETIEVIAHNEGMNSRQLRIFNLLAQNEQPVTGSLLKLQEQSDVRPATYKPAKEELAPAKQTIKLTNTPSAQEFLPTKKSVQQTEEVEFGYGAERPAGLTSAAATPTPAPVQQVTRPAKRIAQQQAVPQEAIAPMQQLQSPVQLQKMDTREVAALQENAKKDRGDLPESLDAENQKQTSPASDEPVDEIEQLKAKLDKAVYARSSKSNVKVSSDDSAAVFNKKPTVVASQKAAIQTVEENPGAEYHTVQKGDTGYSIAKKHGIKVKQLNEMNNLNFEGIKIGQKLRVK